MGVSHLSLEVLELRLEMLKPLVAIGRVAFVEMELEYRIVQCQKAVEAGRVGGRQPRIAVRGLLVHQPLRGLAIGEPLSLAD